MKTCLTPTTRWTTLAAISLFMACTPKPCVENPVPDCVCTMQYDPVCGCNNKTYGNACEAECAGIKKYTKGPCPESNDTP